MCFPIFNKYSVVFGQKETWAHYIPKHKMGGYTHAYSCTDCLSYIFIVSEEYKDYTFDYDDMAG